ncbi:long-chain fatty acid--CoA ligase [Candidatus Poribacteria bacterium]|nr:long-chain fatty acid--CoA ligase [Candidatus Poribacteria bacterium]
MDDKTIGSMFLNRAERYGARTLFKVKRNGQYMDISWTETARAVKEFAMGLLEAGIKHGDRVALLSENRPEWAFADLAILSIGAVNVPIYATNTPKQVEYIINNSASRILIVSNEKQIKKALEIRPNCPLLEKIVIFDEIGQTDYPMVCTFKETCASGAKSSKEALFKQRMEAVKPQELASIIYTSGTTGDPKGVMLIHDNFLSNCRSVQQILPIGEDDVCLSFLPLSHSFERMAGYYVPIYQGVTIAYAESIDTVRDNLKEIKPTFMASVPRIYEKFYAAVLENVKSGSPTKQKIFDWSFRVGRAMSGYKIAKKNPPALLGLKYKIADALVFKKIKENVGGRLKYFVSGGAPLAQEINEFFHALGVTILEGYGLTETSPVLTTNTDKHFKFGTVGKPVPDVTIKIAPDGEILAKGPNIMVGYFNKPEDSAEALDKDGFFHTGDIGVIDEDGFLKITDRKKDIIVTAGGKNVAPQNIENMLKSDPLIANVMVHGDKRKFLSALVAPEFEKLKVFAAEKGIEYNSMSDLVKDERVVKLISERIEAVNKELAKYESIKKFAVIDKDFTMESGELTPTLKVKRKVVSAKYKDILDSFYKE